MTSDQDTDGQTESSGDDAYTLEPKTIAAILFAVDVGDKERLSALMAPLHPADVADLLEQINSFDRTRLVRLHQGDFDGETLSELDEGVRAEVIAALHPETLADAVRDLDSDDVVDLVEDLAAPQQEAILGVLPMAERLAVQRSLAYPEYSAGRLMQREIVAVPEHWTVGQTIDHIRSSDHLPDQFYHVILVDPRMHPLAHVTLGRLMGAARHVPLRDITEDVFHVIPVDQDEGEVAYAFNQYHLISTPVVDKDGRLVGVITIDDAMLVLDQEHEEDMLRLAGVSESSVADSVLDTAKARLPWLMVNLVAAIMGSLVIAQFDGVIGAFVALAILMPIVASMGGNAATQTLTVSVRALATKDLTGANVFRVLRREVLTGLLNGTVFAVVMGIIGTVWFGLPELGLVIAAAIVINMVLAGFVGTVVPVVLDRVGADPALASGTFVTMTTDIMGFFAFLGLAAVVLL